MLQFSKINPIVACLLFGAISSASQQTSSKNAPIRNSGPTMDSGVLLLHSDRDCTVYVDGQLLLRLQADKFSKLTVTAGEHVVEANSTPADTSKWSSKVSVVPRAQLLVDITFIAKTAPDSSTASLKPPEVNDPDMEKECRQLEFLIDLERFQEALKRIDAGRPATQKVPPLCVYSAKFSAEAGLKKVREEKLPNYERTWTAGRAQALYSLGDYLTARAVIDKWFSLGPRPHPGAEALSTRALISFALGEDRAALQDLNKAINDTSPQGDFGWGWASQERAHLERAIVEFTMGRLREAVRDCEVAERLSPSNSTSHSCKSIVKTPIQLADYPQPDTVDSRKSPATISEQIDSIASSGTYSRLPEPQSEVISSGPLSRPTQTFGNRTPYAITIWLSGPEEQEVSLQPGESKK